MDLEGQLNKALAGLTKSLPNIANDMQKIDKFSQVFVDNMEAAYKKMKDNSFKKAFANEKKNLEGINKALKTKLKFMKDTAKLSKETGDKLLKEKLYLNRQLKQAEKLKKLSNRTPEQDAMLAKLEKENEARQISFHEESAALKMMNSGWLGVQSKVGTVLNGFSDMWDLVSEIGGFIGNIFSKALSIASSLLSKIFEKFLEIQKVTGNVSADMGLTTTQMAQMRREVANAGVEATQLGVKMEEIGKIQSSIAEATGRNVILSREQLLNITEIGKGTALGLENATELASAYDLMGTSTKALHESMSQNVKDLQKSGLNGQKVLNYFKGMFQQSVLISGAFKNMEKGIMTISKLSAKYRADLTGITQLSDQIFNPEGAIELAAKLKVLGGGFADMADPFKLMYQGQNDVEGLTKSIVEATKASAIWNETTKQFEIPPKQRGILKEVAEATGQSADNLANMAIQSAKFNKINAALGKSGQTFNDDLKEYIENITQFDEKGNAFINVNNGLRDIQINLNDINAGQMAQIERQLSNTKSLEQSAKDRMTVMERIQALGDKFFTMVGEKLIALLESDSFNNFFDKLTGAANYLIDKLSGYLDGALSPDGPLMSGIGKFFDEMSIIIDRLMTAFDQDGLKGIGTEIIKMIGEILLPAVGGILADIWKKIKPLIIGTMLGGTIGLIGGAALSLIPGVGPALSAALTPVLMKLGAGAGAAIGASMMDDGRIGDPKSATVQTGQGTVNVQKFAKGDALYAINEKAISGGIGGNGSITNNNYNMPGTITVRVEGGNNYNFSRDEILKVIGANYQDVANKSTKIAASESNTSQQGKRNPSMPVTPLV